jgi:hypothetical protein
MGKRVMVLLTDPELVTESVPDKSVVAGGHTYDLLAATGQDLGEPLTDKMIISLLLLALPLTVVVQVLIISGKTEHDRFRKLPDRVPSEQLRVSLTQLLPKTTVAD